MQIDLDLVVEFGEGNGVVSLKAPGPVYKIGWGREDRLSAVRIDLDIVVEFGDGNGVVSLQSLGPVYKRGWGTAL